MKTKDLDALISYTEEATDHYAEHLAEVNKETDVVATEDIYNKSGVLVARRGARIDHGAAKRLVQHKLLRPIEDLVVLKDSLDNRFLYQSVGFFLKKYPALGTVHAALAFEQDSRDLLLGLPLHSLIVQKLTVLSRQLPEWFEKAVFCAWLMALVLRQLGADRATTSAGLVAGFTHDLGFLHLPPAVINKKTQTKKLACDAVARGRRPCVSHIGAGTRSTGGARRAGTSRAQRRHGLPCGQARRRP